jgi:hypothetical protein
VVAKQFNFEEMEHDKKDDSGKDLFVNSNNVDFDLRRNSKGTTSLNRESFISDNDNN